MYTHQFVMMALRLYKFRNEHNMSISYILKILKIARSTLYEWIDTYMYENESNKYKREIIKQKYKTKITDTVIAYIINYVNNNPIFNIKKLKLIILKQYKVDINIFVLIYLSY